MPVSALTLADCDFFAGAPASAIQFASTNMLLTELRRREVLSSPDSRPFAGLGVVLQGGLQALALTQDGREAALSTVQPQQAFGHAALLAAQPYPLTWVATASPTILGLLPADAARALMDFPEMALRASQLLAQQVCDFWGWQALQAVHPVSARLCAWLLLHSARQEAMHLPTHAEIAWRLNTTRESVTRVLQRLLADNVLQRDGAVWRVARPPVLQDLARGEER